MSKRALVSQGIDSEGNGAEAMAVVAAVEALATVPGGARVVAPAAGSARGAAMAPMVAAVDAAMVLMVLVLVCRSAPAILMGLVLIHRSTPATLMILVRRSAPAEGPDGPASGKSIRSCGSDRRSTKLWPHI